MKIYTRKGDMGETSLIGDLRVSKSSTRVDTYGTLDELNCMIGLALSHSQDRYCEFILLNIQRELFDICSELACPPEKLHEFGLAVISKESVQRLEKMIDNLSRDLPHLKGFILPGGTQEASFLHVARATCRRAERKLIRLAESESVRPELIGYINRLSDLIFQMARHANFRANIEDLLRNT